MLNWYIITLGCIFFLGGQAIYYSFKVYKLEKEAEIKDKKLADWKKHCENLETLQEYFMNHIDSLNNEIKEIKSLELKYQ